jgi:hypothetical protein
VSTRARSRLSATALVTSLACVGALPGCSADEPAHRSASTTDSSAGNPVTDAREIRTLYREYEEALHNGPPRAICDRLTARVRQELGRLSEYRDCEEFYGEALQGRDGDAVAYPRPIFLRVEVKQSAAIARVKLPGASGETDPSIGFTRVRFLREDGEWRVDGQIDMGPL